MVVSPDLEHRLRPYLQELARFQNSHELEASPLYRQHQGDIDELLNYVWQECFALPTTGASQPIRAVAWNIERGKRTDAVIDRLSHHPDLQAADVLLLSELDWGMARTANRFVAREIAAALHMNYAFAPCYLVLTKGAGVEKTSAGENEESLHGNAVMSRHPMRQVHSLALPNGKDKMKGAEKRIGSQRAVFADIDHPAGAFRVAVLHLDAHSSQSHRCRQMQLVVDHLDALSPKLPVLIGGDWNTTTHDASRALYSILGYFRRVAMGVRHVVQSHYPYPERWFERRLFGELERRGYSWKDLNIPGECTLHYNIRDLAANLNMGEWVPQWCFWFINRALNKTGGSCSMKLDWFAGKEIHGKTLGVIHDLRTESGPVSDHDPIVLGFEI